jgi:hypothetical protein
LVILSTARRAAPKCLSDEVDSVALGAVIAARSAGL